jgi:hypothetical protein
MDRVAVEDGADAAPDVGTPTNASAVLTRKFHFPFLPEYEILALKRLVFSNRGMKEAFTDSDSRK